MPYKFVLSFGTPQPQSRRLRRFVKPESIVSSPDSLRNQNVAEQHRKRLVSNPNLSPPIPRGQSQRLFLPSVTHLHHVADPAHQRSLIFAPLFLQKSFQRRVVVKNGSSIEFLPLPVTITMCSIPLATHSSTTYWNLRACLPPVSISLGCAFVAGRNRVPRPPPATQLCALCRAPVGAPFSDWLMHTRV